MIIADRVVPLDSALLDFSPVPPVRSGPGAAPLLLDLTGSVTPELDAIDAAIVATVGELSSAVAVWRAWRLDQVDRFGDGPVRVYVVETRGEPVTLPSLTALLQDVLSRAGVRDPQVETYGHGTFLPRYLRQARGRAALIWAASPAEPATIARVFDSYDPATGGRFDNDYPLLSDGDDRARVLRYLEQGRILLTRPARRPTSSGRSRQRWCRCASELTDDGSGPTRCATPGHLRAQVPSPRWCLTSSSGIRLCRARRGGRASRHGRSRRRREPRLYSGQVRTGAIRETFGHGGAGQYVPYRRSMVQCGDGQANGVGQNDNLRLGGGVPSSELVPTVLDCLAKARQPHDLRVVVCWQHLGDEDISAIAGDPRYGFWSSTRGRAGARAGPGRR